ncbi:kinesin motor domain protein [Ostertagia ostertagi]
MDHLNRAPSGTAAKKPAFSSTIKSRYAVTKPLPDSLATGRATMAVPGGQPRYLQPTAARSLRVASSARPGPSENHSTAINRRSTSNPRESAEVAEMRSKIAQNEGELVKLKAELELTKSQLQLKDQNLEMVQSSVECFKQTIALKDAQMSAIQMALEAEKGKSAMMQVSIDAHLVCRINFRRDRNAHLKHELCERMEDIGRLTSQLAAKRDELREKDEVMRHLHNAVVDLKGQIRVAVRVRPPLGKELDVPVNHLSYPGVSSIKLDQGKGSLSFEFQRVFGPNMSQARVFNDVEELILSCLHGYNVSIIAYGQTGSGKTHTMRGGEGESEGIIPRAVKFLFQSRNKLADLDWKFEFKASFLEVYNEEVYDLLGERKKLDVKMGSGTTCVTGLNYREINAIEDIEHILAVTDRTRSTAATKCNEQSSRSHAVFELTIQGHNKTSGASRNACLHLVDLAGSERVKESGAEGDRFKEMTHINSALSNLQNCIRCQLNKVKPAYTVSVIRSLTMILRDSLGAGNSKTMVIVALNPAVTQIAETKRSLEFAQQMTKLLRIGSAKKQEQ